MRNTSCVRAGRPVDELSPQRPQCSIAGQERGYLAGGKRAQVTFRNR